MPIILGVALLHPNLSPQMGPALSRLLARSKLGRSILRGLLRSEMGEVANRRAWHNTDKLTPEVCVRVYLSAWCFQVVVFGGGGRALRPVKLLYIPACIDTHMQHSTHHAVQVMEPYHIA